MHQAASLSAFKFAGTTALTGSAQNKDPRTIIKKKIKLKSLMTIKDYVLTHEENPDL
jgi:hypothetical protein